MAGTVKTKTNYSTEKKNLVDTPEEKSFFQGDAGTTSKKRSYKGANPSSKSNSRGSNTHKKSPKIRRSSAKWGCLSCGTRNPQKNSTCKSCGGTLPTIALFKASRRDINLGNPIRLSWEAYGSDKVLINPGNELVENVGVLDVDPYETTEYTLTAINEFGLRKLSTKVTLAPPQIEQFKATEKNITIGFPTILHWKTMNAESLEVNMDIGDVSNQVFTEAYLTKPGTCTLIAKNRSGEVKASIKLFLKKPEILNFTVDSTIIKLGRPKPFHVGSSQY